MFRKISIRTVLFGVMVLGSGLLWGCGGNGASQTSTGGTGGNGGGSSSGPGDLGGGTPQSSSVIKAVMDAADIQFSGIVNSTADHDARNQQMVTWLKSRSEFANAGVMAGADSVWGQLKNGQLYIATSSFIPGETRSVAAPPPSVSTTRAPTVPIGKRSVRSADQSKAALADSQSRPTRAADPPPGVPLGQQARVLLSLDPTFFNPPNSKIADMLRDHKYTVLQQTATIENLKHVQGDSAFWWGTHGTIGWNDHSKQSYWAAWTADDISDANNTTYKADLDDGSLVHFTAAYKQDPNSDKLLLKTRYAITTKFIDKYNWSFEPNCFIFMDCCHSDNGAIVIDMANRGTTGSNYGWSGSVLVSAAWRAGLFAFDRMLGIGKEAPAESPAQRPFDSREIFGEMGDLGYTNGGAPTKLVSRSGPSIALAPSISYMEMSERIQESPLRGKSKLTLHGIFSDKKGTVKIGGVEVPIDSWAADKIECEPADLPGTGFAGDVQVIAGDRPSNTVSLTQWHGKLTYDIDLLPSVVSTGHATITADVYFRGDVHKYREGAGRDPLPPKVLNFRASQGSTCHWQVTGDPPPMATWSGPLSADLPFGLNGTVAPPYGTGYIVSGALDADKGTVKFSFNYLGCATGYTVPGSPGQGVLTLHDIHLTSTGSNVGSDGYVVYANNIPATIGSDFVIPGETLTGTTPIYNPKLVLADFIPTYQPEESKGEDNAAN